MSQSPARDYEWPLAIRVHSAIETEEGGGKREEGGGKREEGGGKREEGGGRREEGREGREEGRRETRGRRRGRLLAETVRDKTVQSNCT